LLQTQGKQVAPDAQTSPKVSAATTQSCGAQFTF